MNTEALTHPNKIVERPPHVLPERVVDFDLFAPPDGTKDYYQAWKNLQDSSIPELVWTPYNEGHWIATSGRLISQIFADYQRFSSNVLFVPKSDGQHHQLPPSVIDPPEHKHYRALLRDLAPAKIRDLEDEIRALAVELIEGLKPKGECEVTTDFAEQFPVRIFMNLVNLPMEDAGKIKYWVDQTTRPDGSMSYGDAIQAMVDYIAPVAEARRGGDGDDMITHIVNGKIGDRPLTEEEAGKFCAQVLVGGVDTIVNMTSLILHHLATHPDKRRELIDNPSLIKKAVEEYLRRFPLTSDGREVKEDIVFEGVELKKGEMVVLPAVLHGLDERENACPMTVDFNRQKCSHSTFGNGAHLCPGAHLARTEIRIVLEEWLKRIPNFSVAPGAEITYICGIVAALDKLPLVWEQ